MCVCVFREKERGRDENEALVYFSNYTSEREGKPVKRLRTGQNDREQIKKLFCPRDKARKNI